MRNLKRVLSLALALVMVLGMMVISSSAAIFTDDAEITNTEAVEVLYNLGVVSGMGDGSFAPNGTFTREQAAKMITYMKLGPTTAEKLAGTDVFDDVAATRWSAKYIGYCANLDIIAGVGDNKFNPDGKLTDIALGKMLLVALGYDATDYVGANWATAVTVDMLEAGLVNNVTGTEISREDACQMILTAMKKGKTVITYDIQVNNQVVSFDTKEDALLYATLANGTYLGMSRYTQGSLLQTVYYTNCTGTPDEFDRPATTYSNGYWNAPLVYTEEPTLTYTTGVKSSAIYNALGLKADVAADWYINGHYAGLNALTISKTNASWKDFVIGGEGTTVEVYYDAYYNTITIVEVESFLAKVINVVDYKAATATTDEVKASITVEVAAGAYTGYEAVVLTDGYKKGDYVIVTGTGIESDALAVASIAPATVVTGKVEKYSASTVTVGGVVYNKADCGDAISVDFTTNYKLYTDGTTVYKFGTVDPTIPTNYVYVVNTEFKAGSTGSLVANTTNVAKANVYFVDGTNAVIDLAINNNQTAANLADDTVMFPFANGDVNAQLIASIAASNNGQRAIGNWFAYEVKEDGTYVLSKVDTTFATIASAPANFAKDTAWTDGGKYMTSATVVTAVDAYGNVTSFTGLPANNVTLTGAKVIYTYAKNSTTISNIYVYGASLSAAPATAYAYAAKQGETTAKGTEWTLYVGGETVVYTISGTQPTRGYVYEVSAVTSGTYAGTYTLANGVQIGAGNKVTVADATYFVAGSQYYYAKNCAVYNVATGVYGTVDTIEVGDYVQVVATSNGAAALVYIVAEAE